MTNVSKTGDSSSGMQTDAVKSVFPTLGVLLEEGFVLMPQVKREVKEIYVYQNDQTIKELVGYLHRLRPYVAGDWGASHAYDEVVKTCRSLFGDGKGVKVG